MCGCACLPSDSMKKAVGHSFQWWSRGSVVVGTSRDGEGVAAGDKAREGRGQ